MAKLSPQMRSNLFLYIPVLIVASLTRLIRLGNPQPLLFDERYYVIQAYALLKYGTEQKLKVSYTNRTNQSVNDFSNGLRDVFNGQPYFSPHPPLGEWFLSIGQLFGSTSFWWRLPAAICGILTVLLFTSVCKTWFNNTKLAFTAGMLLAGADTLGIALNRIGMLDTFLEFLIMLAFFVFIKSRQLEHFDKFSKWNFLVVAILGLSCGVKWSGVYYLLLMIGFILVQQTYQHRNALRRFRRTPLNTVQAIGRSVTAVLLAVIIAVLSYAVTWTGWFVTDKGFFRKWSEHNPNDPFLPWMPDTLRSWLWYHHEMLQQQADFTGSSSAIVTPVRKWFFDSTGTVLWIVEKPSGVVETTFLANPVLWFSFPVLLVITAGLILAFKRWGLLSKTLLPVVMVGVGYLPWLMSPRIAYTWYQLPYIPFVIMSLISFYVVIKTVLTEKTTGKSVKIFQLVSYIWLFAAFLFAIYWIPRIYFVEIPWRFLPLWSWQNSSDFNSLYL